MLRVIDCSRHDNDRAGRRLDFVAAKRAGYYAVIPRWGVGNSRDPYFSQNLGDALAAGMWPGAYWVPYPGNAQKADATRFLADVKSVCGTLDGVAVALDVEDFADGKHISRTEADVAMGVLRDALGRPELDYIPRWWLIAHKAEGWSTLPTSNPWWDSSYPFNPNPPPSNWTPAPKSPYLGWNTTLWQYSSATPVPGMTSNTDVSAFFGDASDWARLTGGDDDVSYDDAVRALRDVLRLPANGLAVPQGQPDNGNLAAILVGMAQQNYNNVNAIRGAVGQVLSAVGAQADDEEKILTALTAMHVTLSDEDLRALAQSFPAVDYDRIRQAVQFNVTIEPTPGGST